MRFFLIGTSHHINQVIYANTLLFKKKVDAFIVLSENKREYYSHNRIPVLFYPQLNTCMYLSDATIVLDSSIPHHTLQSIRTLSLLLKKQAYFCTEPSDNMTNCFEETQNKPCVLHVFVGTASQVFEGESLIYSIFNEKQIAFFNSNRIARLSTWLDTSEKIFSNLVDNNPDCCDLLYVPLLLENNIVELRKHWNYLERIKPDYVIVQTDCSSHDFGELCSATKYICNRRMDIWIYSRYYNYTEKGILSYQKNIAILGAQDINSNEIVGDVSFDLLSKISFPSVFNKYL